MLKKERQAYILHRINLHKKVLSAQLSNEINVSEDTIRRDLQELAGEGKIIKVHGGALSHSFGNNGFVSYASPLQGSRKVIAQKAIALIEDKMFVLTSGGSTIIELARNLPPALTATFISGSVPAILEYMQHPTVEVIVIGDKVSKNSRNTAGSEAIAQIRRLRANLCFIDVNAITVKDGITDNEWETVQFKKAMIESSQKVVCLATGEKLDTLLPILICETTRVHTLVTELSPDDGRLKPYREAGIEVL